jgi:hypothetical protein
VTGDGAPPEPPPFLFVVGCGRSGTTVLRTALDAHPRLAVAHEGRFVAPLALRRGRYEQPEAFAVERFVADMLGDRAVRTNLGFDEEGLRGALGAGDGHGPVDYPDAVRRVFAAYAARQGKDRYGDKMPGYVLRVPLLADLLPESRFVHIIRDGRDVALSTGVLAGRGTDLVSAALNWRTRVTAGRTDGAALAPGRYHEVRYEALVTDPEAELRALAAFAGLPWDAEMLRHTEQPEATPAKVRDNPRHARLAEPLSPGARTWRTAMDRADVEAFEAVAGDLLADLGYERATTHPPARARARATWGRAAWQVRRTRARLPGAARRAVGQA